MTFFIEQSEASTNMLKIPFRVFTSNGTTPDTGVAGDAIRLSFAGGAAYAAGANTISAISANAGWYLYQFATSEVTALGVIGMIYDLGDFPQHVGQVQVVRFDPFGATLGSAHSRLQGGTTSAVSLGSGETSTNDWFNGAQLIMQYASGNVIANEISDYTGATNSAQLKNTLPIAPPSSTTYWIVPGTVNDLSTQTVLGLTNIGAATFSGVTIQGLTNYSNLSGDISNLTVRPKIMAYSGLTVEINNATGDVSSRFTVGAGTFKLGAYSGVSFEVTNPNAVADAFLDRNMATGTDSNSSSVRTPRSAFFAMRNRVASDATQILVYKADDTTVSWGASKQTTAATTLLTGMDPNQ